MTNDPITIPWTSAPRRHRRHRRPPAASGLCSLLRTNTSQSWLRLPAPANCWIASQDSQFRSLAATRNYMNVDKCNVQYAAEETCTQNAEPRGPLVGKLTSVVFISSTRLVVKPTMRLPLGQPCDGLAKLESKVGLQLVKSTEHLCVLQKEVRLQLRLVACCRIAKTELQTARRWHFQSICQSLRASRKPWTARVHRYQKKLCN